MPVSFFTPVNVFTSAALLRIVFFFYGLLQDAYGPLPYTDIDYFVFTDAARYVYKGFSPYERETYRYTPLLAWILIPTAFPNPVWFSFGKILFVTADIAAGWLLYRLLQSPDGGRMDRTRALRFASIWLLNPMVATISTRGSSEGLLGVMVLGLLWAVLSQHVYFAGALLGLAVHFKIYPFIYGVPILLYIDQSPNFSQRTPMSLSGLLKYVKTFPTRIRLAFLVTSLATLTALNVCMYSIYGVPFLQHTFLYHLTRIDHRHNFSPYNTLLHLSSSQPSPLAPSLSSLKPSNVAFLPQLLLSSLLLPIILTQHSLPATLLTQTFAFVTFNKVCTSQYFLWYLVLLPFYLPSSSLLASPRLGTAVAVAWVGSQGLWLWLGWRLEFLGESVFVAGGSGMTARWIGGLWGAGLLFLGVNCWILGIMVMDVAGTLSPQAKTRKDVSKGPENSILERKEK